MASQEPASTPSTDKIQADVDGDVLNVLVSSLPTHPKYNDQLICIMVDGRIYRVSKSLLTRSARLSEIIQSHPDGEVVPLIGVGTLELESFLEVLHARQTEPLLHLTVEDWARALYLATEWGFAAVRTYAIERIEHQHRHQDALDRLELAERCSVLHWLHPTYNTLCTRGEPITADEGKRLGFERFAAICRIRELYHQAQKSVGCSLSCTNCKLEAALLPAHSKPSDAMKWITGARELRVVIPELAEEGITEIGSQTETTPKETSEGVSEAKDNVQQTSMPPEEQQEATVMSAPDQRPDITADRLDLEKEKDRPVIDITDPIPQISNEERQKEVIILDHNSSPLIPVESPAGPPPAEEAPRARRETEVEDVHPCPSCETPMTRTTSTVRLKIGRSNKPENFKTRTVVSWVCEPCQEREKSAAQEVQALDSDTGSEPPNNSEALLGPETATMVRSDSPTAIRDEDTASLSKAVTSSERTVQASIGRTSAGQSSQQDRRRSLTKTKSDSVSSDGKDYSFVSVSAGGLSDAMKSFTGGWFDRGTRNYSDSSSDTVLNNAPGGWLAFENVLGLHTMCYDVWDSEAINIDRFNQPSGRSRCIFLPNFRQTEAPLRIGIDEWGRALHIATKWGFDTVRNHIIKRIERQYPNQDTLDRFELAIKCRVPKWLHPVYNTLCTREERITADEGRRLGFERLTAICEIREIYHLAQVNSGCPMSCEGCQLLTTPSKPSDAMRWITEARDLQAVFPEQAEDTIATILSYHAPPSEVPLECADEGNQWEAPLMTKTEEEPEDLKIVAPSYRQYEVAACLPKLAEEKVADEGNHFPDVNTIEPELVPDIYRIERPTRVSTYEEIMSQGDPIDPVTPSSIGDACCLGKTSILWEQRQETIVLAAPDPQPDVKADRLNLEKEKNCPTTDTADSALQINKTVRPTEIGIPEGGASPKDHMKTSTDPASAERARGAEQEPEVEDVHLCPSCNKPMARKVTTVWETKNQKKSQKKGQKRGPKKTKTVTTTVNWACESCDEQVGALTQSKAVEVDVHLRAKDSSDQTITKLKNKLIEASCVYSKDKETISWFVMQSVHDPRDFTIVERYEQESSQQYHLNNPYWKTFDPYVMPLLEGKMDLRRFEELDTSRDVSVE
ncbi:hypothetical protein FRB98_003284 [Tulasnella sp. 332]|nr:hypothetical protein FRB98_003284 [Tulasnella sp. 332]